MRLKEIREERGYTQSQIAEHLHIKQCTYSLYENEKRQIPLDTLIALSKLYEVSTDYLLELTEIEEAYPKK